MIPINRKEKQQIYTIYIKKFHKLSSYMFQTYKRLSRSIDSTSPTIVIFVTLSCISILLISTATVPSLELRALGKTEDL